MKERTFTTCPLCQKPDSHRFEAAYPLAVCPSCVSKTADSSGRKVFFYNDGVLGFQGFYRDSNQQQKYRKTTCYINNIKCRAQAHKFGGIVVEIVENE
jgi:hypothetical protein